MSTVTRISMSLPRGLADFLKEKASERRVPVSAVVADLLARWRVRQHEHGVSRAWRGRSRPTGNRQLGQLMTVDKSRMGRPIGRVIEEAMKRIDLALKASLSLA